MTNKFILTIIVILITFNTKAQKPILFVGGIAHIGNGEVIENSAISIKEGSFDIVANANLIRIDPTAFDTIIKIYGKHIYPSFIVPNTTLGITEIDAVRASRDFNEIGGVNPNIRSLIAYNSDSKITKTIRTNGVLIAQVTPRGGLVSGQSSIMFLEGNNWEDAALKVDDGIHINWPNSYYTTGWWAEPGETKENKKYSIEINQFVHGNLNTSNIDSEFLLSGEYKQIIKTSLLIKGLIGPGAIISRGEKSKNIESFQEAIEWMLQEARNTLNVQRYKGLGEMNPEQLWETTMDPSVRRLLKVTIEDTQIVEETFTELMGDNVEPRRKFIESNALAVSNLDI